jgi:NADH-quinone oxidoreductase subunit L
MTFEAILVLAPLVGAFIAGVFQKPLGDRHAMAITTGLVGLSAALSVFAFVDLIWGGGQARTQLRG